ncbi:uncharacterized protein EAF02_006344 [Botrytis sinoallii]|uniref:uncharacterized protein n=1 Tax=Botrytis sinoallii TaxID=1463999 RepID=UPI00190108BF|nr:uncharacterized protein EAF02_006344 [Botrytis sinoallii]KAF7881656.1 hypothetical protein EAF02_006344 [Botrytis sinoallii]
MSTLPINTVPRDKGVIYHSMSLFYNKIHSKSRYRPLPEKRGFQFMKLPAEMRNTIWGLTIEQRLIEVRFTQYEQLHNHVTHDFVADVPIALHICQESRNFALGHYELTFDHDGAFAPVYFNFKLDILYPRASCSKEQLRFLANNMDKKDCDRVTYLAMYNEHLERTRSLSTWRALPLRFPNLDAFIILFKSFVDPTTVDEETLPPCKYGSA